MLSPPPRRSPASPGRDRTLAPAMGGSLRRPPVVPAPPSIPGGTMLMRTADLPARGVAGRGVPARRPGAALAQSRGHAAGHRHRRAGRASCPAPTHPRAQPGHRGGEDRRHPTRAASTRWPRSRPASTGSRYGPQGFQAQVVTDVRLEVAQTVVQNVPHGGGRTGRRGGGGRRSAGDREHHHLGRPGHQPAHGAGDPAQRPPLRGPRACSSRARWPRSRTAS